MLRGFRVGLLLATIAGCATAATAQGTKASKTSLIGHNLYQMERTGALVQTAACTANARGEPAALREENGTRFLWFFSSETRCDVVASYHENRNAREGTHRVKLQRVTDDFYREFGRRQYIRTVGCAADPMAEDVKVELQFGGSGWLSFSDGQRCRIAGVYGESVR